MGIVTTQEKAAGGVSRLGCYGCRFCITFAPKVMRRREEETCLGDGGLEKLGAPKQEDEYLMIGSQI